MNGKGDTMSIADEIEKLNKLRTDGAISETEYQRAKDALLAQPRPTVTTVTIAPISPNQWAMFIHLSQLLGLLVPVAGLVVPIVLWQIKKDESEIINQHGKIVTNWIITAVIAGAVSGLLCFVIIGIPLVIALVILCIVFPILGGLKANEGQLWKYPMSIEFIK